MDITITKKLEHVNILTGFQTFGVIGPIIVEYLLEHLDCEKIGEFQVELTQPIVAIHEGTIVKPIELHYNNKYNLLLVRSTTQLDGQEMAIADALAKLVEKTNAWQLISIEGVVDQTKPNVTQVMYFAKKAEHEKKLKQLKLNKLNEGIILGLTAALLSNELENHVTLFATTHSQLPDSQAAAEIIKILDAYLGLEIDPKPLLAKAQNFESQIGQMQKSASQTKKEIKQKNMSYVG